MYFGPPCFSYALIFEHTRDTSVIYEKAKFVCFIYMQPQKVKFTSVQINMKQVSYIHKIFILICSNLKKLQLINKEKDIS